MTAPVLTATHLRKWGACTAQTEQFAALYPNGLEVTTANAEQARRAGLDTTWLEAVLTAPAGEGYDRAVASAWEEYDRACASAGEEYDRAIAPAGEEYRRAIAPAREAYRRACASALVAALLSCWDEIGGVA